MNKNVKLIVRIGMLLAIALAFQALRAVIPSMPTPVLGDGSNLIIGSLVNLVLFVAVATTGVWGGIVIAIATPVVALLQGHIPFPQMIFVVAAGNLALVLVFNIFVNKIASLKLVGVISAAVIKTAVLWTTVSLAIAPFLPNFLPGKPAKALGLIKTTLIASFSWPQLVTALIGGAIALAIIPVLKKAIRE